MSNSVTKLTRTYFVQQTDIFQNMESMARAYNTIFPESTQTSLGSNDIVRIDMQHELRFNTTLRELAMPFDNIMHILKKYPKQIYLTGGIVNLALDPLIDTTTPIFAKSDIDMFILVEPRERMKIVTDILTYLYSVCTYAKMCVGVRGSVIYVWHNCFKRMIQLILIDTKNYQTIDSVIKGFDLDNIAVAYDGRELIIQLRALQAMNTRRVTYRPTSVRNDNQMYRMAKTASRGYKIFSHATGEEITPSLAQILADKESRDYLCTPYTNYIDLFSSFDYDDDQNTVEQVLAYYKTNSTASEVFYINIDKDITNKVIPLVNPCGISNIENSREYNSAPPVATDAGFEVVYMPNPCTYVSGSKRMKVITLDTIDKFTSSDIVSVMHDNENKAMAFPYYASMRRDVCLELQLDKPIEFPYKNDTSLVKLYLSESNITKFQEFINKFVRDASNLFYRKNNAKIVFSLGEKINELTKWKSVNASTLASSPKVDNADKLTKLSKLIEASKSIDGQIVRICVNAFVRKDDIRKYTMANVVGEVKSVPVCVSYHLCL